MWNLFSDLASVYKLAQLTYVDAMEHEPGLNWVNDGESVVGMVDVVGAKNGIDITCWICFR